MLLVQKYGGTSVQTPELIRAVAQRIRRTRDSGAQLVVVVSAMGHTTDELIELARQVSPQPPLREMDMLLTAGERISMSLLSMALAEQGVQAVSLTGSQSGIITDGNHSRARIDRVLGQRVRDALMQGKVPIVAGFQGVSHAKDVTTLGRGGSDTTAVALAAALAAERCDIYTDVDGVYSADPRKISGARFWGRLPASLVLELAARGAGVLHPRSVALARKYRVPIRILNALREVAGESEGGTQVLPDDDSTIKMESFSMVGVTSDVDKVLLRLELARSSVLSSIVDFVAKTHLALLAPVVDASRFFAFIERDFVREWDPYLQKLVQDGFILSYQILEDEVPLSLVGQCLSQDYSAVSRTLDILSRIGVLPSVSVSSSEALTLAVPRSKSVEAVQLLHEEFLQTTHGG